MISTTAKSSTSGTKGTTAPKLTSPSTAGKTAPSSKNKEEVTSFESVKQRIIRTLSLQGGRMATKVCIHFGGRDISDFR